MSKFRVGDKVQAKPGQEQGFSWKYSVEAGKKYTVARVAGDGLDFIGGPFGCMASRFELVKPAGAVFRVVDLLSGYQYDKQFPSVEAANEFAVSGDYDGSPVYTIIEQRVVGKYKRQTVVAEVSDAEINQIKEQA